MLMNKHFLGPWGDGGEPVSQLSCLSGEEVWYVSFNSAHHHQRIIPGALTQPAFQFAVFADCVEAAGSQRCLQMDTFLYPHQECEGQDTSVAMAV